MTKTRFIGDVHGKYKQYKRILKEANAEGIQTIQVGDMGVGFKRYLYGEDVFYPNPPYDVMVKGDHKFIRGNHDNPEVCRKHTQWISDGATINDVMFVGGALSIDAAYRTEGYTWWRDEELTYDELDQIFLKYQEFKPRVMITHECPEEVACRLSNVHKLDIPSVTRQAFDNYLADHQPEIWVFGHWHTSFDQEWKGTRFICLNELETVDLDVDISTEPDIV